ncbi:hypothetical protein FOA52_009037 [Chlamydomonas sp. UWO 241]|nr:hypothetical protein FOA52_009037 [Chlamydomonas sp. UWO 241]
MQCCKCINKASLTPAQVWSVQHETQVMVHLRGHPNVVDIMGVFEDDAQVHIVQDICTGPSLDELLKGTTNGLSESQVRPVMNAVLAILAHCHTMGVLYRDVKPEHFLLSSKKELAQLKAIDFGISVFLKPGTQIDSPAGTPSYWAPEVLDGSYGFPSDVWSAGVMMYQLLTGHVPFSGKSENDLYRAVCSAKLSLDGDAFSKVSPQCKALLSSLLCTSAPDRPTAQGALSHEWFWVQPTRLPSRARFAMRMSLSGLRRGPSVNDMLQTLEMPTSPDPGGAVLARMRRYAHTSKFSKAATRLVVHKLEVGGGMLGMEVMFGGMDTGQRGQLSPEDIQVALKGHGAAVSLEDVTELLREMETDADGRINYREFLSAVLNRSLLEKKDLLADAFQQFDADGDGVITQPDLDAFVAKLAAAERKTSPEGAPQFDGVTAEATSAFLRGSVQLRLPEPPAGRRGGTSQMCFEEFVSMMLDDSGTSLSTAGSGSANGGGGGGALTPAASRIVRSSTIGRLSFANTSTGTEERGSSGDGRGCAVM